jgi:excisionase family DNA binding protein
MSVVIMSRRRGGACTVSIECWAEAIGVSRATAYSLANQGKIPGLIRIGRRMVVSRQALDELLASGGTIPAAVKEK